MQIFFFYRKQCCRHNKIEIIVFTDIIIDMDVPQNETQGMVCENADSVPSVSNITLFEKGMEYINQ